MVIGSDPEYGVYERLAVAETEITALKAEVVALKSTVAAARSSSPSPSPLSKGSVVLWALIAAAALGNGSSVMEVLRQVIAK